MADINHSTSSWGVNSSPTAGHATGDAPSSSSSGLSVPLSITYPVNTVMELKLAPHGNVVRGLIYCTDDISNSIVIKRSLVHTTLSSEITVIHASSVMERKAIDFSIINTKNSGTTAANDSNFVKNDNNNNGNEENLRLYGVANVEELTMPLPNISKKSLEEREKRAIRLVEESFKHVNQMATPKGQHIFDKLLKACNQVVWNGDSILVLNHIRVDPPYLPNNCTLVSISGGSDEDGLERVKKIVGMASDANNDFTS